MMSSTQNAGRASKDRGNKTQNSPHNAKSSSDWHKSPDGLNPKVQPTAEQIRMAQIANDTNKSDDPDVKKKVEQIMELTGKPSDTAIIALHDCDNDPDRAVIMLLEGNSSESKWETTGNKRKKSRQQASKGSDQQANSSGVQAQTNHAHGEGSGGGREHQVGTSNNKENRGERGERGRGGGGGGGGGGESKGREDFRNRGPPRLSRGNGRSWRNKENEKNERNLEENRRERNADGRGEKTFEGRNERNFEGRGERGEGRGDRNFEGRERSFDGKPRGGRRGGARGRGGGMGGGGGREARDNSGGGGNSLGGGGGGRVRTFQNRSLRDVDSSFPQSIDTWTNSTAEQASTTTTTTKTNGQSAGIAMGNWSEFQTGEDWSEEDWTEGLTETKVFTPSTNVQPSTQPGDDAGQGVQISQNQERSSLFHKQSVETSTLQFNGQLPSASPPQQMQASSHGQSSSAGTTSIKPHPGAIPSSGAGPPVASTATAATQQTHFNFSQYAQQAAETIKAAVGIPSSMSSSSSSGAGILPHSSSTTSSGPVYGSSSLYATSPQQQQASSVQPLASSSSSSVVDQHSLHQHPQQVRTVLSSSQQQQQQQQSQVVQHPHQQQQVQQAQQPQSVGANVVPTSKQSQGLPPRVKSQRPRIPPPSKIPESAVEMPDDAITNLDVQFGALEFGTDSSPFDYTGISKSTYQETVSAAGSHLVGSQQQQQQQSQSSVLNSHTSSVGTSSLPVSSGSHSKDVVVSAYSNLVSQQSTPASVSSQQQNSTAHITKDLSQSSNMVAQQQQQKVSGPESILLSQSERKNVTQSSYGSQRSSSGSAVDGYTSSYTYSTQPAYPGSNSNSAHPSKMGSSLSHSVDTQQSTQHSYDQPTMSSMNAALASSSSSVGGLSSANLAGSSSALVALAASAISTSSSTNTTSVLKNSLSATKTLPSIPPGVPATAMLGHQYIMSQAATLPFYGLQQTLYSYEEMQMLQSRMPTLGYYDMQFTAPASLTTGRDPNMANIAYTGGEMKFSRTDADASGVVTTMSQGQNQSQTHGQTLFNPALPPGYGYYFTGGMMPGSIPHYPPPIFSVPPATNTHGATSNTQYQKATAYNSHSYGSGTGTTADLSNSIYNKSHQQIAKPGVPMGASSTPYTAPPFIPVLAHGQHHSTMMHHHMQDSPQASGNPGSAGGAQRGAAQAMTQPKGPGASNKQNIPYWSN